jgi:hypothetical protein
LFLPVTELEYARGERSQLGFASPSLLAFVSPELDGLGTNARPLFSVTVLFIGLVAFAIIRNRRAQRKVAAVPVVTMNVPEPMPAGFVPYPDRVQGRPVSAYPFTGYGAVSMHPLCVLCKVVEPRDRLCDSRHHRRLMLDMLHLEATPRRMSDVMGEVIDTIASMKLFVRVKCGAITIWIRSTVGLQRGIVQIRCSSTMWCMAAGQ